MSKLRNLCETLSNKTNQFQDLILILIRITLAIIFIQTGWGKLTHLDITADFFRELQIPMPYLNAVIASSIEFLGGIALITGLLTRLAAFGLMSVMAVAIWTAKAMEIQVITDIFGLQEWDYLLLLGILLAYGAGKLSLDRLFCKK